MIALCELRRCQRAGETLGDVVARFVRAESGAVPPLIQVSKVSAGDLGSA